MAPHSMADSTPNSSRPHTPRQRNSAKRGFIVQKFGGTSIGKFAVQIAENIVAVHARQSKLAIVCSARSTDTKAEGTTNRLLRAAEEAMKPGSRLYADIVDAIREDHIRAAREAIRDAAVVDELQTAVEDECGQLARLLGAAQIIDEISPKTKDSIIGAGEKLSCLFMTALLKDRGIDAEYVNLENILPPLPAKTALNQKFYDKLAGALAERISKCGDRLPVVTGYFGVVPGSLLASVGRGYTDLCAALLAVGLDADELQVWKEVDGIFTADPRKVVTARLIPVITPEEASELTYYGSEVIHPFTMEQVIRARIPIRIKNVENPGGDGTMIFPDTVALKGEETPTQPPRHVRFPSSADPLLLSRQKRPTAVTTKNNIVVLNVHSNRKSLSHGFFASIFSTLDKWRLAVDLISTSEVHVSMALHAEVRDHDLREAIADLRTVGSVDVIRDLTILSLVGKQMKHMIGIAGRMFSTLAEANVNIEMISQGASEINISCVIQEKDAIRAMNVLHTKLFTYQDD